MLCYRDRTYCSFYKTCKEGTTCNRALTPKVIDEAKAFGLLVAEWWPDKPDCWTEKQNERNI